MDDVEPPWKAEIEGWVNARDLGSILGRLYTKAVGDNPARRGALLAAVERIRQAEAKEHYDEVTAIAREANRLIEEANRLSEKANGLSGKANRLAREANQGSKRARCTAWLAFAIAVLALMAQIYPLVFSQPAAVPHLPTSP